ncbi:DUF896 domain-containing protein [Intestinibaculum porci]|jgi:uncharacterized protein YnzC (UPF0291/DUF896 family)|uniref:UPF0291 protein SG0102_14730 n=1 Tax=Intestinibaculum porci TaxID=2487118 RepID=A0A3G9JTM5_9FIRM|nr:DUF896 domain-containing protein [Intestinibaculum porci]MDD6350377.1 DUF896 domain-containing protein [Intestinibaculum porci]MDD6422997.1 DUF896 domain-containing protein [Intestinibaculum porci]BBH26539.1 UPF0291 protein [Intestinibaculum porci]HAN58260.1 hypothetical protein [Erysipelotrichaceae bacterium]
MANEMEQLIAEINALAHKSKEVGLTDEEKERQQALRAKYIEIFKGNLRSQLENIRVVDPNGNDITPRRKHKKVN